MPNVTRVPMVPERYALNVDTAAGMMRPQVIVEHVMGGHFEYALEMMRDKTVGDDPDDYASWHFSIAQDGRIAQHASIFTPCMGAGLRSNSVTSEPISTFRKRWHYNPNAWTVHIEHEDHALRPAVLTEEQIEASIRVHRWIWNECEWLKALPRGFYWQPDTADGRFVYHSEIDPANRPDDPGPNFPWNRVVEAVLVPDVLVPDDFQRGRREVSDARDRIDAKHRAERAALEDQQRREIESLPAAWSIP